MTFADVKEELHQLLDETRREIRGNQCMMSGVTYERFLQRRDALVFACKIVDTVSILHSLFSAGRGDVCLRSPFRFVTCECGHSTDLHIATVGSCMQPGCDCKMWERQ